jgi:hypothetical protein
MTMPSIEGQPDDAKELLLGWEWIKAALTWAVQQHLLYFSVLDQEKIGVKLNKSIIVKGEAMNGDEIFVCTRNMKNIIKNKVAGRSGNDRFTNTRNLHTCTIGRMYLVVAIVAVMHGELV